MSAARQRDRRRAAAPPAGGVRIQVWLLLGVSALVVASAIALAQRTGSPPAVSHSAKPANRQAIEAPARAPGLAAPARPQRAHAETGAALRPAATAPEPEVTTLEAQAARLVAELPPAELDPSLPPFVAEALAPPPPTGSPEAQLRSEADEVLVQYALDGVFSGQVYPWGFPVDLAVQQQRSLVAAMSPEQRAEALEAALRSWTPRRAVPRFADPAEGGALWEGGGMDRWLLQDATQSPR